MITSIVASTPPAIAIAIGGIGMLSGISGAGILVSIGVVLQVLWIFFH